METNTPEHSGNDALDDYAARIGGLRTKSTPPALQQRAVHDTLKRNADAPHRLANASGC